MVMDDKMAPPARTKPPAGAGPAMHAGAAEQARSGPSGPGKATERETAAAKMRSRRPLITDISAARWLLLAVLAASTYFFHGFIVPVLASAIIALATWPLRDRLAYQWGLGRTGAAAVMVITIICVLIVPLTMALYYTVAELRIWIIWALRINALGAPTPDWIVALPQIGDWLDTRWQELIGRPGGIGDIVQIISGSNIAVLYRGVLTAGVLTLHIALSLLFTLITLAILYRDGEKITAQIDRAGQRILPGRWQRLSRVVPATISSTVTGMTLIAIGEGVILGTAYFVAGVPSPIVFGVITGFMALIPGGAPLSFTLISGYLVASGSTVAGAGLFLWGTLELFIVDKTIRPTLVGGPIKLPFLPTFFGLVGGVQTMGLVGLFVGPVLMALLVAIWREWQRQITLENIASPDPDTPGRDLNPG